MKKYKVRINNPIIGVPITFLDKYDSDQFEIIGMTGTFDDDAFIKATDGTGRGKLDGHIQYARVLIRWKSDAMPVVKEDGVIIYGQTQED